MIVTCFSLFIYTDKINRAAVFLLNPLGMKKVIINFSSSFVKSFLWDLNNQSGVLYVEI